METKNIAIISTGGTIASKRNSKTGLLESGVMSGEELSKKCKIPNYIRIIIKSVFQIPSSHMTFEHLIKLKQNIETIFKDTTIDGVVITHGTDTLEETAFFLDLVISNKRPLVITGSQRGPELEGTDAFVNLKDSIILAASKEAEGLGTVVLFNEKIFSPKHVKKNHASNINGFDSKGVGYLGTVDQQEVYVYQKPTYKDKFVLKQSLPTIEVVKTSLGSDGKFIDCARKNGASGIIIEGFGRGHVPPETLESIEKATKRDVYVILTTSAEEGNVKVIYDFPGSVKSLKRRNVILAKNYDSKKAKIKLAVMIASKKSNISEQDFIF